MTPAVSEIVWHDLPFIRLPVIPHRPMAPREQFCNIVGGCCRPLLANLLLDDLDKGLERRGYCFCRYADDCNIYVQSRRAGERVLASVTQFLEGKLEFRVNHAKNAVAFVQDRKFLGHRLLAGGKPGIAPVSLQRAKVRIRRIIRCQNHSDSLVRERAGYDSLPAGTLGRPSRSPY